MNNCKIAERLTELRIQKGITQNELAKALSVSNKTVSKWENGLSAPNLNMLVTLSDFYGVSTDSLLGREDESTPSPIPSRLSELRQNERIMKIFSYLREIAPENMIPIVTPALACKADFIPDEPEHHDSSIMMIDDFFNVFTSSEDLNLSFLLLRNKSNFSWMNDPETQNRISEILEFLSDKDTLSACYFLHSTSCSNSFTANYIAEKTGISTDKATEILNRLCKLKSCKKRKSYLREGERVIFEFIGDGLLLGILSLVYLKSDVNRNYDSNACRGAKMIVG